MAKLKGGAQDAAANVTSNLGEVSKLAHLLVEYDQEIAVAELRLTELKENARRMREESLPSAMNELGLTEVVLGTGEKIKVQLDVYAAIPADQRAKAYLWLEENGFGALIKTEVSVQFGREEREKALELANKLRAEGLEANADASVHAQTLKAWLREQLGAGKVVPLDLFGARPVSTAKITLPRKK